MPLSFDSTIRVHPVPGDYTWRVRAFNPLVPASKDADTSSDAQWVAGTGFTITEGTPNDELNSVTATSLSPPDGTEFNAASDTKTATIDFNWDTVEDATVGYYVFVAREGKVVVNRKLVSQPPLEGMELPPGHYRWTVAASNKAAASGGHSDWALPAPRFTVFPAPDPDDPTPGVNEIDKDDANVTDNGDGTITITVSAGLVVFPLKWIGNEGISTEILAIDAVTHTTRILTDNDDMDLNPDTFTTDIFTVGTWYIKIRGIAADGTVGHWSRFIVIKVEND